MILFEEGVTVRPGDILVVRLGQDTDRETANQFGEAVRAQFPEMQLLVLFGGPEQIRVVRKEDRWNPAS